MSDSAKLVWQIPPRSLAQKVRDYFRRLMNAVYDLATYFAAQIEAYAKQHAPWTDRTGNARQGLTARAFKAGTAVTILLFHTMSYGIWLEVKNAGRFAIILPTLRIFHPQVMAALRQLARG
jgi:hypothetical protein